MLNLNICKLSCLRKFERKPMRKLYRYCLDKTSTYMESF